MHKVACVSTNSVLCQALRQSPAPRTQGQVLRVEFSPPRQASRTPLAIQVLLDACFWMSASQGLATHSEASLVANFRPRPSLKRCTKLPLLCITSPPRRASRSREGLDPLYSLYRSCRYRAGVSADGRPLRAFLKSRDRRHAPSHKYPNPAVSSGMGMPSAQPNPIRGLSRRMCSACSAPH